MPVGLVERGSRELAGEEVAELLELADALLLLGEVDGRDLVRPPLALDVRVG